MERLTSRDEYGDPVCDGMKPILFNTEMVQAILDGRKTATRRVIKQQVQHAHWWEYNDDGSVDFMCGAGSENGDGISFGDWVVTIKQPYKVGDVLYVRETYYEHLDGSCYYRADGDLRPAGWQGNWTPSIHMPKEAARLFLRVINVRPERLQDIFDSPSGPNNQIVREGYEYGCDFIAGWQSTIKRDDWPDYGWDANPWVWVIEFERIDKPEE